MSDCDDFNDELRGKLELVEKKISTLETKISALVQKRDDLYNEKLEIKQEMTRNSNKKLQEKFEKNTDTSYFEKMDELLKTIFHIKALRSYQLPTINAVMQKQSTILIMPTGGGKSLCYQLPALLLPGVTVVISPLVSLMEDQVMALQSLKVAADLIHSGKTSKDVTRVENAMMNGELKLVYCTPERMSKSKRFMSKLEKCYIAKKLSLFAIDEVHCCSQWGHDFRRDFQFLGVLRKQFPKVPILGLTATAPSTVLEDVQKFLRLEGCLVFKAPLNRPNLFYQVRQKSANHKELILEMASLILNEFPEESGIVYCFSIKDCTEVAKDLRGNGIKAREYHGNMDAADRKKVHVKWVKREIYVIVATIAFGMGIDKPDVRFVIHHSMSKNMESYYQESGRAGRDDKPSKCILFYRLGDMFRQSCMVFSERTGIEKLYGMVAYCIDQTRCRREIISQHFDEVWDDDCCRKMCDSCVKSDVIQGTNVTKLCNTIYKILDKAGSLDQRLTAIKLLDTIEGKANTKLRPINCDVFKFSRETLENIIAMLLVEGYLEEDFHYTPYSTISYLKEGMKSDHVRNNNGEVLFNLPNFTKMIDLCLPKTLPKCAKPDSKAAIAVKKKADTRDSSKTGKPAAKRIKVDTPSITINSDSDSNCEVNYTEMDSSFGKFK